jgi:hypothetical protein
VRPILLTVANQRTNEVWGDKLQEKPINVTRVYAMNVNGLRLDRLGGQFDVQCQVQKEVQADILCGQEHNLDSDKTHVRSILYETARQHWQKSRMRFGTTPISFANMYKPGGTHIISTGDITGQITHQESDKWGRWVSQTFRGQEHIASWLFRRIKLLANNNSRKYNNGVTTTKLVTSNEGCHI